LEEPRGRSNLGSNGRKTKCGIYNGILINLKKEGNPGT
jgi:hypothetical protein